ncbi:hypothetical protein R6Q59_034754, partial [Mikania micrantha]
KDLFVNYLKECNYPKTDEIASFVIKKVKCGRLCHICYEAHGKVHGGPRTVQHRTKQPWNEEKGQLNNLRRKYLYHILDSDVNLLKEDVRAKAQK